VVFATGRRVVDKFCGHCIVAKIKTVGDNNLVYFFTYEITHLNKIFIDWQIRRKYQGSVVRCVRRL